MPSNLTIGSAGARILATGTALELGIGFLSLASSAIAQNLNDETDTAAVLELLALNNTAGANQALALSAPLASAVSQLNETANYLQSLQGQINEQKSQLKQLQATLAQQQTQLAAGRQTLANATTADAIEAAKAQVSADQAQIAQTQSSIDALQPQIAANSAHFNALQATFKSAYSQVLSGLKAQLSAGQQNGNSRGELTAAEIKDALAIPARSADRLQSIAADQGWQQTVDIDREVLGRVIKQSDDLSRQQPPEAPPSPANSSRVKVSL
jgi:chromosome segregation ATPase